MRNMPRAEPCPCGKSGSKREVRKCRRATGKRLTSAASSLTQYQKRKNCPSFLWSTFKAQAKSRKIANCLSKKRHLRLIKRPCKYCGGHSRGSRWNGIDRLDSNGPYTKSNVVPCCSTCNFMKGELSVGQFYSHLFLIARNAENAELFIS